jgi:RNA polymerase sigma factor (sigma-70 family)
MNDGDGEDVKRSFGERCEGARVAVWRAIRQRRPEEPEMVWADVCVKAWRRYPAMYREEQEGLAEGRPSRHDWTGWLVRIAVNHMIDLHRRTHGRRKGGKACGAYERRRLVTVSLRSEVLPAPPEADPQVLFVLEETWRGMNEAIGALDRSERAALSAVVLDEEGDEEVAVRLGMSARTVRRRRRRAIGRLHEQLAERGWDEARHFRVVA